jgi:two-component system, OmpR family, phosphate regulon sensor histidine kinase PhoR
MFSVKNLSPRQLSALIATLISIAVALGIGILQKSLRDALIVLLVVFTGTYLIVDFIFQQFIYRKIKIIYKIIYRTKATKKEEMYYKYILPQKNIDEVKEDVEAWAVQQKLEIENLRKNEIFRKEFLQNLSHEFKTPVFAIQGYIDTLLQGAMENPEINRRFLEKASKNVERLSNLIQDLDEISRLERGELKLSKHNFVIQDVIRDAYESLTIKAEQQNITFSFKKGCEQPKIVYADKDKIYQVVVNLIENSIKYGRMNGFIVASVYNTDEKNVLVEISDDGMGIPEKYLPRVFERFYRTQEGRNRNVTGSGLGLAICKHIIEAHNHSIHIRSKEDVGTTVGFTVDSRRD